MKKGQTKHQELDPSPRENPYAALEGLRALSADAFHRITEWSGLEGTSVGHLVQPPAEAGSPTVGCRGPCPGGSSV